MLIYHRCVILNAYRPLRASINTNPASGASTAINIEHLLPHHGQ